MTVPPIPVTVATIPDPDINIIQVRGPFGFLLEVHARDDFRVGWWATETELFAEAVWAQC